MASSVYSTFYLGFRRSDFTLGFNISRRWRWRSAITAAHIAIADERAFAMGVTVSPGLSTLALARRILPCRLFPFAFIIYPVANGHVHA